MSDGITEARRGTYWLKEKYDFKKPNPPKQNDIDHMPNQKRHKIISFIKSGVRIVGYLLILYSLPIAVGVLIFSELIGIIEELV